MKKLMLVFAAIAITAGAYAQADSANRKMSPKDANKNQNQTEQNNSETNMDSYHNDAYQNDQNNPGDNSNPDGVMMENGKMMKVKNGEKTVLEDNDMAMNNGTKIMSDGNYIKKDGTKTMMKEGQRMDMSGNMISSKKNSDKNMYLVPDSTRKE